MKKYILNCNTKKIQKIYFSFAISILKSIQSLESFHIH